MGGIGVNNYLYELPGFHVSIIILLYLSKQSKSWAGYDWVHHRCRPFRPNISIQAHKSEAPIEFILLNLNGKTIWNMERRILSRKRMFINLPIWISF